MKPRKGHTRWKAIVYEPGKIEGFDDSFVAYVHPCRVTKVLGGAIYYRCGYGGNLHAMPYICSEVFWNTKTYPTYRKAFKAAMNELETKIRAME